MRFGICLSLLFLLVCTPAYSALSAGKVGLAVDSQGVGDFADNDLLVLGASKAGRRLGLEFRIAQPERGEAPFFVVQRLVDADCGVVMASGDEYAAPVRTLARMHPNVRFVLIDSRPDAEAMPSNVTTFVFRPEETAYLAGIIAGAAAPAQWVGVLFSEPGKEQPEVAEAFHRGARSVNPGCGMMIRYVSERGPKAVRGADKAPGQARFMAGQMYNAGCSVILSASGYSDTGVFQAAAEHGKLAVGAEAAMESSASAHVLTTLNKRKDMAVLMASRLLSAGELKPGVYSLGLAERGVGLTPVSCAFPGFSTEIAERVRVEAGLLAGKDRPTSDWTPAMAAGPSIGLTDRNMACQ